MNLPILSRALWTDVLTVILKTPRTLPVSALLQHYCHLKSYKQSWFYIYYEFIFVNRCMDVVQGAI